MARVARHVVPALGVDHQRPGNGLIGDGVPVDCNRAVAGDGLRFEGLEFMALGLGRVAIGLALLRPGRIVRGCPGGRGCQCNDERRGCETVSTHARSSDSRNSFRSRSLADLSAEVSLLMFAVFGILIHASLLAADPHSHLDWVMNAMNLALTGTAWVVADALGSRKLA